MKKVRLLSATIFAMFCFAAAYGQEVKVSYDVTRLPGGGSNQIAVWVEDLSGNYIRTIYASQWTAKGGYKTRPLSLSSWIEKSNWASAPQAEVDAVSGSTQSAGRATVVWDCKDRNGKAVKDGKYVIRMEANIKNERKMFFSGVVAVGRNSSKSSDGKITFTPEEASAGDKIFANVVLEYVK